MTKEQIDTAHFVQTPQHYLNPRLEWVGKVLGMDLYVDLKNQLQPEKKRQLAEEVLKNVLGGTNE